MVLGIKGMKLTFILGLLQSAGSKDNNRLKPYFKTESSRSRVQVGRGLQIR